MFRAINPDVVNSGIDRRGDPAVLGARSGQDLVWAGDLLPGLGAAYDIAVAGARKANGVTIAVINLKLIWDVISAIHVGRSGDAFVLDQCRPPRRPSRH